MSGWISWGQLGLAGVALDIAGAAILALSFMTKNPVQIAREIPLHGMSFGLPRLARSLVRQRAEAQLGLTLLVLGFSAQAVVYYTAHGNAAVIGRREDLMGVAAMALPAVTAALLYRRWVPHRTEKEWGKTWRLDYSGTPLEGDALADAERNFGPGGIWDT